MDGSIVTPTAWMTIGPVGLGAVVVVSESVAVVVGGVAPSSEPDPASVVAGDSGADDDGVTVVGVLVVGPGSVVVVAVVVGLGAVVSLVGVVVDGSGSCAALGGAVAASTITPAASTDAAVRSLHRRTVDPTVRPPLVAYGSQRDRDPL